TVCVVGKMRDLILQLSKSSIYSTKPFIPSIMLSGFISPFISMPDWAKAIGSCLPLTYFIRLVKGIMLKGYSATALLPDLLPLIGLAVIVIGVGLKSYRKTLD
ncbi:ABC transporter permease, partial [Klebsiella pneumoniae]